MLKIDKGVALPPKAAKGTGSKYPWREMQVGDSFLFPAKIDQRHATSVMHSTGKRLNMKFTSRLEDGLVRCWRIQ